MNAKKKKVVKEGKISTFDLKKDFLKKQYIHSKTAHFAMLSFSGCSNLLTTPFSSTAILKLPRLVLGNNA